MGDDVVQLAASSTGSGRDCRQTTGSAWPASSAAASGSLPTESAAAARPGSLVT